MIFDLSEIVFDNDISYISLPDGNALVLNSIDESFAQEAVAVRGRSVEVLGDVEVKAVNIQKITYSEDGTEEHTNCPNIIGVGDSTLKIESIYPELQGKVLTSDNIALCTMEYYEE